MDAFSAVTEIVTAVLYLQEVHAMSQKIHGETANMLGRLPGIVSCLDAIQRDLQGGRFQDPARLQ